MKNQSDILIQARSWSATPWDYSSMRYLHFSTNGGGIAVYGYGQTLYAKINFRYILKEQDQTLLLYYTDSEQLEHPDGFFPPNKENSKTLSYRLIEEENLFKENTTGKQYRFKWKLSFKESPFPNKLKFPQEAPLDYYGEREDVSKPE